MEQQLIHPKLDLRQPQRPIHEKSGQLDNGECNRPKQDAYIREAPISFFASIPSHVCKHPKAWAGVRA